MTRDELAASFADKRQELHDKLNTAKRERNHSISNAWDVYEAIERELDYEWYKFTAELTYDITESVKSNG